MTRAIDERFVELMILPIGRLEARFQRQQTRDVALRRGRIEDERRCARCGAPRIESVQRPEPVSVASR
jgi:hypothetical protein